MNNSIIFLCINLTIAFDGLHSQSLRSAGQRHSRFIAKNTTSDSESVRFFLCAFALIWHLIGFISIKSSKLSCKIHLSGRIMLLLQLFHPAVESTRSCLQLRRRLTWRAEQRGLGETLLSRYELEDCCRVLHVRV